MDEIWEHQWANQDISLLHMDTNCHLMDQKIGGFPRFFKVVDTHINDMI